MYNTKLSMPEQKGRDFKKIYDEQAQAFAKKAPVLLTWEFIGKPALKEHLASLFEKGKKAVMLDVGSASGRVVEFMVKNGIPARNITGVEISPDQVEIAKKNVPGARFEVGDIRYFELPASEYDGATVNMVLEFLDPEGLDQALGNIYQAMKPGSILVFNSTHPGRVEGKYELDSDHRGWFDTGGPWGGEFQNWHRSVNDYVEQTEAAGFSVEVVDELYMPADIEAEHPEFKSFGAPARLVVVARK